MNRRLAPGLLVALGLWALPGCRHAAPAESTETHETVTAPAPVAAPPPKEAQATPQAPSHDEASDLEALVRGTVVSFDYDAASLRPESRERLQKIADAMRGHPEYTLQITGNCDERGTEEYNLVLGQKRAEVARKYLLDLGIDSGRVSTVSYGKERPLDPSHSEDAWARNRRDDLVPARKL